MKCLCLTFTDTLNPCRWYILIRILSFWYRSVVGAMYEAAFPNPKGVDGIIGLADRLESDSGARTPVDDLVAAGVMDDIFGLCLQDSGTYLMHHS